MTIYYVGKELEFPNPLYGSEEGLIAVGGDLSPARLIFAYENGIFPWFSDEEPILWWSPDPRFILKCEEIKISKSMKKFIKKSLYKVTYDKAFNEVIEACSTVKRGAGNGTWITKEMKEAYKKLHRLGYAHSVETWYEDKLVGGLYGISLGKSFFGESMFSKRDNASKTAFINLVGNLNKLKFDMVDCQVHTNHLESLGAKKIQRTEFLELLEKSIKKETICGNWSNLFNED